MLYAGMGGVLSKEAATGLGLQQAARDLGSGLHLSEAAGDLGSGLGLPQVACFVMVSSIVWALAIFASVLVYSHYFASSSKA